VAKQADRMQGTLEMLILKAVSLSRFHGYGVLLRNTADLAEAQP
jgi:PadR family transcriptional regulator PadR